MTRQTNKPVISGTLESYLEEVATLQKQYGAVRITDLAERMGCRLPTATSAVRRLHKLALVNYEAYRPITLTPSGEATVRQLAQRHRLLEDFFLNLLLLPASVAEQEACRLEHRIPTRILRRLRIFLDFFRSRPDLLKAWDGQESSFQHFLKKPAAED